MAVGPTGRRIHHRGRPTASWRAGAGDEQRIAQARTLLPAAILAADAMMRAQRSSGLLDLLSVNYDSSPDTGFTVQQLCTVIELGRTRAQDDAVWVALLGKIEQFIRRAVPGMMDGGFHTPNHRWVIAAALEPGRPALPRPGRAPHGGRVPGRRG